jgi:hypothetical protein
MKERKKKEMKKKQAFRSERVTQTDEIRKIFETHFNISSSKRGQRKKKNRMEITDRYISREL